MTGNATLGLCSGGDEGAAMLKGQRLQCRVARFTSLKRKALIGSLPTSMQVDRDGRVFGTNAGVFVRIRRNRKSNRRRF